MREHFRFTLDLIMNIIDKNAISGFLRDKSGKTIAQFARNNNVSRRAVYDAINGNGSRRIRVAIAKTVKIPPSMLWIESDNETKIVDDLHYLGLA